MNMQALDALVGKPYRFKSNGPAAFDCWSVTVAGARQLFGLELPDPGAMLAHLHDADACARQAWATGQWEPCKPQPGAILAVFDRTGAVYHIGLFINEREVLTASRELGTHVAPLMAIDATVFGWEAFAWRP